MMRLTFALTIFGALLALGALPEPCVAEDMDEGFSRYLRTVLENFQKEMKNGIPELHIPPLDPLDLKSENIDVNTKQGSLKIRELVAVGLSTLRVRDISAKLSTPEASVTLSFDVVRAESQYDLDMLIAKIFPITGKGNFHLEVQSINLFCHLKMKTENYMEFEVTDIDFNADVGNININLENILDPKLAPTINKIINGYGTLVFNTMLPKFKDKLGSALIKRINKEIKGIDLRKLLGGGY